MKVGFYHTQSFYYIRLSLEPGADLMPGTLGNILTSRI